MKNNQLLVVIGMLVIPDSGGIYFHFIQKEIVS